MHRICEVNLELSLKNDLIEILYCHGYSTECYERSQRVPGKRCFVCDGRGIWTNIFGDREEMCIPCEGIGLVGQTSGPTTVCFRFSFGLKTICWYQPKHQVRFRYETTKEPSEWDGVDQGQPVELKPGKVAAAKDLLGWIIAEAAASGQKTTKAAA